MMNKHLIATELHEDAFYAFFEPYRHYDAAFDIWGGLGLETYGKDLETIKTISTDFVWTIIEGEKNLHITPGIHRINRICYLITKNPHLSLPFEFKVSRKSTTLTPMGLKRQINKIQSIYSSNKRVI